MRYMAGVVVALLALSGCGGDDDAAADEATGTTTPSVTLNVDYEYDPVAIVDELSAAEAPCHQKEYEQSRQNCINRVTEGDVGGLPCARSPLSGQRITLRDGQQNVIHAAALSKGTLRTSGSVWSGGGLTCRYVLAGVQVPADASFIEAEVAGITTVFDRDELGIESGTISIELGPLP